MSTSKTDRDRMREEARAHIERALDAEQRTGLEYERRYSAWHREQSTDSRIAKDAARDAYTRATHYLAAARAYIRMVAQFCAEPSSPQREQAARTAKVALNAAHAMLNDETQPGQRSAQP